MGRFDRMANFARRVEPVGFRGQDGLLRLQILEKTDCGDAEIESGRSSEASPVEVGARFAQSGGTFVQPPEVLAARFSVATALVFDWDGVFNRGEKGHGISTGFTEADSMGVNMLRYAIWRRDGRLPVVAIITGENNASAERFAQREHLSSIYLGVKDKRQAMEHCRTTYGLGGQHVVCFFDDINDIAMARDCGIRILVRRKASELLLRYLVETDACDYVTASESGQYALREATELLLGLSGSFEEVVASRCAYDEDYRAYFEARQSVTLDAVAGHFVS